MVMLPLPWDYQMVKVSLPQPVPSVRNMFLQQVSLYTLRRHGGTECPLVLTLPVRGFPQGPASVTFQSDSVRPHRWQPTWLPHPRDSAGKNTGVGCHFLLQCMKVKSESEVAQSCSTLCDPIDVSPPGSAISGICHTVLSLPAPNPLQASEPFPMSQLFP